MDRFNLTLNIAGSAIEKRHLNVRSSLPVASLIATIQDKFNLDGRYELRLDSESRPALPLEKQLMEVGVREGATIVCVRIVEATGTEEAIRRGHRESFSKNFKRVYMVENRSLTEFELGWQPAILGRRDVRNPANNKLLAVDLEDMEELPTVSRHHAAITEKSGSFFIEDIQGRNPVYLDGQRLKQGIQYPLAAGATVQLGRVSLTFRLVS